MIIHNYTIVWKMSSHHRIDGIVKYHTQILFTFQEKMCTAEESMEKKTVSLQHKAGILHIYTI